MGEKLVAFLAAPKRLRRARAEGSKYKQTQNACVHDYSSSLIFRRENLAPILFEKYKPRISANLGESHSAILALTNLRFVRGIRQRSEECWFALPALTENRRLNV